MSDTTEKTPLQRWAEAKQKITELDEAAQPAGAEFLDASRDLWRSELTSRYPEAQYAKARLVIRIQPTDDPQKVVQLGEKIIEKGASVTGIIESEGHFYVIVN
jgi:hypothetical protein